MLPTTLTMSLPPWVSEVDLPDPPARLSDRMGFVLALAMRNVDQGTGGPFAAAVFEQESGVPVSVGVNAVRDPWPTPRCSPSGWPSTSRDLRPRRVRAAATPAGQQQPDVRGCAWGWSCGPGGGRRSCTRRAGDVIATVGVRRGADAAGLLPPAGPSRHLCPWRGSCATHARLMLRGIRGGVVTTPTTERPTRAVAPCLPRRGKPRLVRPSASTSNGRAQGRGGSPNGGAAAVGSRVGNRRGVGGDGRVRHKTAKRSFQMKMVAVILRRPSPSWPWPSGRCAERPQPIVANPTAGPGPRPTDLQRTRGVAQLPAGLRIEAEVGWTGDDPHALGRVLRRQGQEPPQVAETAPIERIALAGDPPRVGRPLRQPTACPPGAWPTAGDDVGLPGRRGVHREDVGIGDVVDMGPGSTRCGWHGGSRPRSRFRREARTLLVSSGRRPGIPHHQGSPAAIRARAIRCASAFVAS